MQKGFRGKHIYGDGIQREFFSGYGRRGYGLLLVMRHHAGRAFL